MNIYEKFQNWRCKRKQLNTVLVIPSESNQVLELHFNLWDSDCNNLHCLDIGILSPIFAENGFIDLFVPGIYKKKCIINLGKSIKDENIAKNIFNGAVKVESETNASNITRSVVKKFEDEENPFYLFLDNFESLLDKNDYITQIRLPINKKNYSQASKIYFRIRILNIDKNKFSVCSKSWSRFFVPYCEKSAVFDFRINDPKLLNSKKCEELDNAKVSFDKVHFLFINDIGESVCLNNGTLKVRVFESHNWGDYIKPSSKIAKTMLAYHVSDKLDQHKSKPFGSSSFLLKVQANKSNIRQLALYTIIVIILSLIANSIYTNGIGIMKSIFISYIEKCVG